VYLCNIMFLCVFFTNVLLNRYREIQRMLRHCISSENNEVYYTK